MYEVTNFKLSLFLFCRFSLTRLWRDYEWCCHSFGCDSNRRHSNDRGRGADSCIRHLSPDLVLRLHRRESGSDTAWTVQWLHGTSLTSAGIVWQMIYKWSNSPFLSSLLNFLFMKFHDSFTPTVTIREQLEQLLLGRWGLLSLRLFSGNYLFHLFNCLTLQRVKQG